MAQHINVLIQHGKTLQLSNTIWGNALVICYKMARAIQDGELHTKALSTDEVRIQVRKVCERSMEGLWKVCERRCKLRIYERSSREGERKTKFESSKQPTRRATSGESGNTVTSEWKYLVIKTLRRLLVSQN